jgi:hypothetical protein
VSNPSDKTTQSSMQLHSSTIKKLFREHFQAAQPWLLAHQQREALVATITQRIAGLPGVSMDRHHYYTSEQERARYVCSIELKRPGEVSYFDRTSFQLLLNEQGALTIQHAVYHRVTATAVVASLEQLVGFLMTCLEVLERQAALATKRQKVRDLKAQAIVAQVKKLAREEQFDFYTKTDTVKLTLYVKIADDESLELQIAFKDFDKALPNLRSTIVALRALHKQGIKFKLSRSHYHKYRWLSHTAS